jgi:hypothetical protein
MSKTVLESDVWKDLAACAETGRRIDPAVFEHPRPPEQSKPLQGQRPDPTEFETRADRILER